MSSVHYLIGKTLGKYQILEHLGHGGMSEVYKGQQPQLNRMVAVKVLHPFLADEEGFVIRFQREARLVATLRHPNIVQVYDFDYHDELAIYYMVMEYIDGQTLKDLLENGPVAPEETIRIGSAIAEALDYAHQRGLVHRDIKPANIMFLNDKEPVLTDFGIARMLTLSGLTASGAMVGTPAYMAPEIGTGKAGQASSDIYSLSVVLYQAVTGSLPFMSETPMGMVMDHISKPPPRPSIMAPHMPESLEQVILRGMEKSPAARFPTAGEMALALRRILDPVQILPPVMAPILAYRETDPKEALTPAKDAEQERVPPDEPMEAAAGLDHPGVDKAGLEEAGLDEADDWLIKSWPPRPGTPRERQSEGSVLPDAQPRQVLLKLSHAPAAWLLLLLVVGLAGSGIWYGLGGSLGSWAQTWRLADSVGAVTDDVTPTTVARPTAEVVTTDATRSLPTARPSPSPIVPTATADCTLRGRVEHVAIEPNRRIAPLTALLAYVTVRNSGTCSWPAGLELRLNSSGSIEMPERFPVNELNPGAVMQLLFPLTAPEDLGTYPTTLEMRDATGRAFGSPFKIDIIVEDLPFETPTAAAPVAIETTAPLPLTTEAPVLVRWEDQPAQDRWTGVVELVAVGGSGTYRYYRDEVGTSTEIADGRVTVVGRRCESVILNLWVLSGNQNVNWQEQIPFPAPERCW